MNLCIGRIPFLVCAPFFYHFFTKNKDFSHYQFEDGVPSALNKKLSEGCIHLAPCSSFNFALHPGKFVLAKNLCTSCNLEVQSVKLFSKKPIHELQNARIHLTSQSASSIALLKILLELRFKIQPVYIADVSFDKTTDDAKLLIGDEALKENLKNNFAYNYDLGTLWQEWQHVPFVFGAWNIHKKILQQETLPLLKTFLKDVEFSVEHFKKDKIHALKIWKEHIPFDIPISALLSYYDALDYTFTEERKYSLEKFFAFAEQIHLIEKAPKLEFLETEKE